MPMLPERRQKPFAPVRIWGQHWDSRDVQAECSSVARLVCLLVRRQNETGRVGRCGTTGARKVSRDTYVTVSVCVTCVYPARQSAHPAFEMRRADSDAEPVAMQETASVPKYMPPHLRNRIGIEAAMSQALAPQCSAFPGSTDHSDDDDVASIKTGCSKIS
eukprot:1805656-Rhodomonas_salina.1